MAAIIAKEDYKPPADHRPGSPPGYHEVTNSCTTDPHEFVAEIADIMGRCHAMVLVCSDPRLLHETLNASSISTLEKLIISHVHATPPSNLLKDILDNRVFYDDEIGRCPKFEGEDRQLNAEWVAALGADMKLYPVNYHLRRWAHCIRIRCICMKMGLAGGGNLGVGAQCTMISLIASSFTDQPYHRND